MLLCVDDSLFPVDGWNIVVNKQQKVVQCKYKAA